MKTTRQWSRNWILYLSLLVTLMISTCSSGTTAVSDSEQPVSVLTSAFRLLAMLFPIPIFGGILAFGLTIPALSAAGVYPFGGRKRRDLTEADSLNFDIDRYLLTFEQSRTLASLAALVEHVLENYTFASKRELRRPAIP